MRIAVALALLSLATSFGCSPKDSGGSGSCGTEFCNELRFGTSLAGNGFDLAGEGDTFSVAKITGGDDIWFRLESQDDLAGRAVRLYIYSGTGSNAAPYWQKDYTPPQSYGHILLSSFRITDQGTYSIRSYLVDPMGTETHVIDEPITMTP